MAEYKKWIVAPFVLMATVAAMATPAQAFTYGMATFTSPDDGHVFATGSQVTYTIYVDTTLGSGTVTNWDVSVDGQADRGWLYWSERKMWTIPAGFIGTLTATTDALPPDPDSYWLNVCVSDADVPSTGSCDGWDYVGFSAVVPLLSVSNVSASPQTFYPIVRDGYKDITRIEWSQSTASTRVAVIRRSTGKVVRRESLGQLSAGWRGWRWDGRKGDGSTAAIGKYRVVVTVSAGGVQRSASTTVEVATGWRTTTHTLHRSGTNTSSRGTSGSCFISAYSGVLKLDCWGGNYARASYGFSVPSNATNVRRSISKGLASDDFCCQGSISATWSGNVATVQATGWRAVDVYGVTIKYDIKKRI